MGDAFWHPVQELHRVPVGWRMPRTRYGNAEGAVLKSAAGFEVWVRVGDEARQVGVAPSLADAAVTIWRWGREDRWPR